MKENWIGRKADNTTMSSRVGNSLMAWTSEPLAKEENGRGTEGAPCEMFNYVECNSRYMGNPGTYV